MNRRQMAKKQLIQEAMTQARIQLVKMAKEARAAKASIDQLIFRLKTTPLEFDEERANKKLKRR